MRPKHWDIFCRIVDNFGDIGVCWRLARQLADEHGLHVRLWVDDLIVAQRLLPTINPELPQQPLGGVTIAHWTADFAVDSVAEVVIEAFACELPDDYILAMVAKPPIWINLEYLSAETWVEAFHQQPSPHPRLALKKTFFFPGFTTLTGGLLRENDLIKHRDHYQQAMTETGNEVPLLETPLRVSLFAYPQANIATLLASMAENDRPVLCLVPESSLLPLIRSFFQDDTLQAGEQRTQGALTVSILPFLSQVEYDQLLWSCDLNFVRGEDSWIRAIWTGRPFVWQPYIQAEDTHITKLQAFLERYLPGLEPEAAKTWHRFHHDWAQSRLSPDSWHQLSHALPAIQNHTIQQALTLAEQADMASQLIIFVRNFQ
ncbi:elongation factor P maturation arginine rhamnosyltransferase EarP [Methylobacillus gramineus]|uniref:elongation factor P maturation arginine rhamnosyltransferase EarP n=1 Tax=Methylobacillus gramineus TaxID=755169 RepID=UPI001CFFE6BA|nr:elongation factor P maturation arginine rhamnosyltransferase EarP [Methylobacillus gramineus]MCB5184603.1 elongation factor P maturation arginine rhamnosyltransferase EarP [Methylobacillus gramineus]